MRNNDQLLDERGAADFLNVSIRTLQGWRARRAGPVFIKLSNRVRYDAGDLSEFIESARIKPADAERGR